MLLSSPSVSPSPRNGNEGAPSTALVQARDDAAALVALACGVDASRLSAGAGHDPHSVCQARQIAMYLLHVALSIPQAEVGRLFGRDRTTVIHACAVVEDRRDDRRFDRLMDVLEGLVSARHRGVEDPPDPTALSTSKFSQPRLLAGFSFGAGPPDTWFEIGSLSGPHALMHRPSGGSR